MQDLSEENKEIKRYKNNVLAESTLYLYIEPLLCKQVSKILMTISLLKTVQMQIEFSRSKSRERGRGEREIEREEREKGENQKRERERERTREREGGREVAVA